VIPEIVTSDFISYPGIDKVLDATKLPYADQSLKFISMLNVFHHIGDVGAFLKEAARALKPGGRVFLVDQHCGLLSKLLYTYLHHEPFHPEAKTWEFESKGPLSDANGALAWMVFSRDQVKFKRKFPQLKLLQYKPHSPLRYWLCGGLKSWSLLPAPMYGVATLLDQALAGMTPHTCSFVDIELQKQ